MIDSDDKIRKGFVTEEDIATLLQRYGAHTVLTLLQEVARYAGRKIDWDAMVKKTSTGIATAREYQMLWRHLAYRDSLRPLEDGAQPLDDDSDLEYELEAFPHVNSDASVEAAAHVKVMITSYLPSESNIPDNTTVEAPLTINIPKGPSYRGSQEQPSSPWSTRGLNITVPVSLQKQPLPTIPSTETLNGNGSVSVSMASRRKRKKWSSEEDQELIAAVEKYGEGNWANILKGDFKGDRTASQLSQRWALIRKKRDTSLVGVSQSGLQRTEAQMAANHALSLAVGHRPATKNLTAGTSLYPTSAKIAESPVSGSCSLQFQHQSQPGPFQTSNISNSVAKSQVFAKTSVNNNSKSDLMVTANTAAAAACMAGPSGASLVATAGPGKSTAVHVQSDGASAKPSVSNGEGAVLKTLQHAPSTSSPSMKMSHQMNAPSSSELPPKPKVKNTEEIRLSDSDNGREEQAQVKQASTDPQMSVEKQATMLCENSDSSSLSKNMEVKSEAGCVPENVSEVSRNTIESKTVAAPINGSEKQSEAKGKVSDQGNETAVKTSSAGKNPEAMEEAGASKNGL